MAYGPVSIGGYMALSPATKEDIGGVKIGDGVNVSEDGTISIDSIGNYAGSSTPGGTANSVNNFTFKVQTSDPGTGSALESGTILFIYS